jgi:carbamoyl-phosphate synthase large subunit
MTRSCNILVSGASGLVGYGILKSLRNYSKSYNLIGITSHQYSIANKFSDVVEIVPLTTNEHYISKLIEIINKHKIDIIIPSIEIDVQTWAKYKKEIENKTNAFILLNNQNLIELCSDKWLFYKVLEKHNSIYRIQTSLEFDNKKYSFPLLLKPRKGYASHGIIIIDNKKTLDLYKDKIGIDLMIQPIIGSAKAEYTVSGFFDKENILRSHITLKRKLSKMGFTEMAETIENDDIFKQALLDLAEIFKPIGPTNFQFRIDNNDQLKLLEINPRMSSASSIRVAFGYNESAMSVEYFLNNKQVNQPLLKKGIALRYTEDFVFYNN